MTETINDELERLVLEMVGFQPEGAEESFGNLTCDSQEQLDGWKTRVVAVLVTSKRQAWPVGTWVKTPDGIRGTIEELNWDGVAGFEVLVHAEGRKGWRRFKLEEVERL